MWWNGRVRTLSSPRSGADAASAGLAGSFGRTEVSDLDRSGVRRAVAWTSRHPQRARPLKVGLLLPIIEGTMAGESASWRDLAAFVAAGRIPRVRFALAAGSPAVPPCWPGGLADRHVGVLVHPLGPRRRDQHDHHRHLRVVHELPEPRAAREVCGHGRRDQRWPSRPWPGRRVARARVPGLRIPVRSPRVPLRGGVHDHPVPHPGRTRRLRWASSTRRATASSDHGVRARVGCR